MPVRIGLVGCVKEKQHRPAAAKDLYTSALFRGRRRFVERSCDRWYVLSALHGLVDPAVVLEPYDVTLVGAGRPTKRDRATKVLAQIDQQVGSVFGAVVEIHAGADYRDWGLVEGLRARGALVSVPTEGLTQGRQLAFYAHQPDGKDSR